jgi:hypothetical protein
VHLETVVDEKGKLITFNGKDLSEAEVTAVQVA